MDFTAEHTKNYWRLTREVFADNFIAGTLIFFIYAITCTCCFSLACYRSSSNRLIKLSQQRNRLVAKHRVD